MSIKSFASGWCAAGNHSHCRGALPRPGGAEPWLCICKCHKGKERVLPEEIKRPILNPNKAKQAETAEWVAQLIIHGHVEVPCEESAKQAIAARIRKVALENDTKIITRWTNGVLTAKVAPVRRKRTVKKESK